MPDISWNYLRRPKMLLSLGVSLLMLAIIVVLSTAGMSFTTSKDVRNHKTLTSEAKTSPKIATAQDSLQTIQTPESPNNTGVLRQTSQSAQAKTSEDACVLNMSDKIDSYGAAIKKERSLLDDSLGFPQVGAIIRGKYIENYNDKVTKLFNQYKEVAAAAHCTFQIKAPELLPNSYPN